MTELGKDNSGGMDDEAYDFPLFSKGSGSESALQRIILRSPTPRSLNPGFLTARRPDGYYFNAPSSEEQMQQYRETAVSSEDVRKELKQKWPGCELPWRLHVINITRPVKLLEPLLSDEINHTPKKRIGKKRRIAIRKKLATRRNIDALAKQTQAEKEAAWKEKQSRKNRQKKLKRREKEKSKKSSRADRPFGSHDSIHS